MGKVIFTDVMIVTFFLLFVCFHVIMAFLFLLHNANALKSTTNKG